MPNGVRSSLIAFVVCTGFVAPAFAAPGTTWTDPPARQPDATAAPAPAAPATPAAVSRPPREEARAVRPARAVPLRSASRKNRIRVVHRARPPQVAAVPERAPRVAVMGPARPPMRRYGYPIYSQAGFPPSYEDERLDRLSTAVGSGYLVVRRRTVEYPDGRMIRFYRPVEGEDD
ncbi:hypothetical protein [Methylobacterium sp. J-076]|uniref:hypothetical protein n=1 Tax=Methylobacterium sp. J-076 TaxID=2836655 RepID=UPI001FBB8148|nr:hypothetical protein [Methylobacterium sp. J-076]MCJ2012947.1 hypothetical protein [Methylobacterium sp. J-076]